MTAGLRRLAIEANAVGGSISPPLAMICTMNQPPAASGREIAAFNPRPWIQMLKLTQEHVCVVVDDALVNPERLVQFAVDHRDEFREPPYAYPGIELPMPSGFTFNLEEFFMRHVRGHLNGRRTLLRNSRLSLVTLRPEQLRPMQTICHRDSQRVEPNQCLAASVAYLFKDTALGGTSFYVPRKSAPETERLVHDASTLGNDEFTRRYGIAQGYFHGASDYFELVGTVPAQWNRMIFYDGGIFHSGDILAPERMTADPLAGRLTLNGFFTCTRKAA